MHFDTTRRGWGRRPTLGLWSRVAGDAVDLATLAADGDASQRRKAAAAVLGETALDVICARQHTFANSTC